MNKPIPAYSLASIYKKLHASFVSKLTCRAAQISLTLILIQCRKNVLKTQWFYWYNKHVKVNREFTFLSRLNTIVQSIIHLSAKQFIKDNNLDFSCEPDDGHRPVDFKISRGQDKTVIELKLSSNPQYMHGYQEQIRLYAKSEGTQNMIYMGNAPQLQRNTRQTSSCTICSIRERLPVYLWPFCDTAFSLGS